MGSSWLAPPGPARLAAAADRAATTALGDGAAPAMADLPAGAVLGGLLLTDPSHGQAFFGDGDGAGLQPQAVKERRLLGAELMQHHFAQ